jgi:regulator of sigma E protease
VTIINSVVPFIAIIIVLVVVHELGHFVTAKLAGVQVLEFGIGYPPRLWGKKFGETEYTINALPLGGFCRMVGEEDPDDPRSLARQRPAVRLVVLSAGSIMNFLFAITLFATGLIIPREVPIGRAVIDTVMPGSPAQEAGLQQGDVIQTINGRDVKNVPDTSKEIRLNLGETMTWVVERNGEPVTTRVRARWAAPDIVHVVQPGEDVRSVAQQLGLSTDLVRATANIESTLKAGQEITIGQGTNAVTYVAQEGDTVSSVALRLRVSEEAVAAAAGLPDQDKLEPGQKLSFAQGPTGIIIAAQYPFTETQSYSLFKAVPLAVGNTFDSLALARNEVISWVKGGASPEVSGPIGIAQATGMVVKEAGWKVLIDFAGLLSVNLAIINILPLPFLDGGRIVFVLLEVVRGGRRVAPRKEALVHLVGLVALLTLVVVISYFDVVRIIQGGSIFR